MKMMMMMMMLTERDFLLCSLSLEQHPQLLLLACKHHLLLLSLSLALTMP